MTIRNQQDLYGALDPALWERLPGNFFWGASTSAYQIEGAAHEEGRGRTIWDDFAATPGKTYHGETGEIAIDHYHRSAEDVELMAQLGLNSYCFSIAWSRVLPAGTGAINTRGLDFYDRLVDELLTKGITPVVKPYHWDLPSALQQRDGWRNRDTVQAYADYVEILAQRLGDRVNWWITQNEPWCVSYLSNALGIHAPGLKDVQTAVDVAHHIMLSHGCAIPRIRAHTGPQVQIGITLDYYPIHTIDQRPASLRAAEQADVFRNRWFLDPLFKKRYPDGLFAHLGVQPPAIQDGDLDTIATPIDFLGLNYYTRWVVRSSETSGENAEAGCQRYEQVAPISGSSYTAMDWEIYPQGLQEALERIHRDYTVPAILITESGAAFPDSWDGGPVVQDPERTHYLAAHIESVGRAIQNGVPVRGYFAWSLTDNFEWSLGYAKRFGIIYIDYASQKRILKESAHWYTDFIAARQKQRAHDLI